MREQTEQMENECPIRAWAWAERLIRLPALRAYRGPGEVWQEIKADLAGGRVMNRLVPGRRRLRKTVVALLALLAAAESGYQGALMAPTEVLARQHAQSVEELLEGCGLELSRFCSRAP